MCQLLDLRAVPVDEAGPTAFTTFTKTSVTCRNRREGKGVSPYPMESTEDDQRDVVPRPVWLYLYLGTMPERTAPAQSSTEDERPPPWRSLPWFVIFYLFFPRQQF